MKHVFAKASELAHIWANQAQDEGRSSNMSFRTRHIYSYEIMIAAFRAKDVVFLNSRSRSSTTSGHQSAVKSACSALTVFKYNCIPNWCDEVARLHEDPDFVEPIDIWEQYRDIWSSLVASTFQSRFNRTASQRLALASEFAEKANNIAMLFTLDCYPLSVVDIGAGIAELIEAENARKKRKRIADFEQCIQKRMDWLEGKGCSYYYPNRYENDIVLRVSPEDDELVETSRGAFVPLRVCAWLYHAFKTATMPNDREVGSYQLDSVSVDGLTIGCHFIKAEELERFAKVLGVAA